MGVSKEFIARAAAILTTGEVAAASFNPEDVSQAEILVDIDFTKGSLTNGIFSFYGLRSDGSTWVPLTDVAGNVSYTFTADTDRLIHIRAPGVRGFRVTVQGTGTVTSSSATVVYRYRRPGAW